MTLTTKYALAGLALAFVAYQLGRKAAAATATNKATPTEAAEWWAFAGSWAQ